MHCRGPCRTVSTFIAGGPLPTPSLFVRGPVLTGPADGQWCLWKGLQISVSGVALAVRVPDPVCDCRRSVRKPLPARRADGSPRVAIQDDATRRDAPGSGGAARVSHGPQSSCEPHRSSLRAREVVTSSTSDLDFPRVEVHPGPVISSVSSKHLDTHSRGWTS